MTQYYNALIHTDLVVPVVTEVPYSYNKFAKTVSVIRFSNETSSLKYFKESPERRLYNEANRRNVYTGDDIPELNARKEYPLLLFFPRKFLRTYEDSCQCQHWIIHDNLELIDMHGESTLKHLSFKKFCLAFRRILSRNSRTFTHGLLQIHTQDPFFMHSLNEKTLFPTRRSGKE